MPDQLFDPSFLKKLEMMTLTAHQLFRGQNQGERRTKGHGSSVEFADFRPYVQGDDFRRIDWNAFARFETLMLRLFVEEQDLTVHILLDTSASMNYPPKNSFGDSLLTTSATSNDPKSPLLTGGAANKFDYARRLAAAVAYMALAHGDQVTLTPIATTPTTAPTTTEGDLHTSNSPTNTSDSTFGPIRGRPGIIRLMETLEKLSPTPGIQENTAAQAPTGSAVTPATPSDLNLSLKRFALRNKRAGLVIIISDFLSPTGIKEGLQQLCFNKNEVVLLQTLAPEELSPQLLGDVRLVNVESHHTVEVSANRAVLQAYHKRLTEFLFSLQQLARQNNSSCVLANTGLPLEELLLKKFRMLGLAQ